MVMGLTHVDLEVANPADPKSRATVRLLVDSGATLSVISGATLRRLGIRPHSKRGFIMANGEKIERQIGNADFLYQGQHGASPVIFGKRGDSDLLGIVTLEALGFMLDPLRRELRPLPMMLA
jgi:predicted aspartyl protease